MSYLFITLLLWTAPNFAGATPTTWQAQVTEPKPGRTLPWSTSVKSVWVNNKEGGRVLKWIISVATPFEIRPGQILPENPNDRVSARGSKFLFSTQSMTTKFKVSAGGPPRIEVNLIGPKETRLDENCRAQSVQFQPSSGQGAPFFIGTSCQVKDENVNLHVTFPAEVELTESSLFESQGKGENWRVYDLRRINAANGELGHFTFNYLGKSYKYGLVSMKGEAQKKKNEIREPLFLAGLGYMQTKLVSPSVQGADTKPFARLELLPKLLWQNLGCAASAEFGIVTAKSDQSISYTQIAPSLLYQFKFGQSFRIEPRLYYVISSQSSGSGVSYQTNQAGVGMFTHIRLSEKLSTNIEAMTESVSSQVIKSHLLAHLALVWAPAKSQFRYGVGAQTQSYTVVDAFGNQPKFNQTSTYFLFMF